MSVNHTGGIVAAISNIQTKIDKAASAASSVIIMVMMFLVTIDVTLRYFFNSPLAPVYDLCEMMVVGIAFLPVAYIQARRGHIAIEVVTRHFPQMVQNAIQMSGDALGLFIFGLMTWRSGVFAWKAWLVKEYAFGLVQIPTWPAKAVFTFGIFLLCVRLLSQLFSDWKKLVRNEPPQSAEGEGSTT